MGIRDIWKAFRLWKVIKKIKGDPVMFEKLKSRKLLALVIGAVVTTINGFIGSPISEDQIEWLLKLVMVYIVGQGTVDALAENAKKPKK
jgi:hypothetical protein